jgi:uncharacterized surface protein with fasciclin (FAS1) repeats
MPAAGQAWSKTYIKMNVSLKLLSGLIAILALTLTGCKDEWEKHTAITDPEMSLTLLEKIQQNPDLSKFNEYLVQTRYDKVLLSSRKYTVWAPTNQALQALDAAIVNDTAMLRQFVGNHIVNQAYFTNMPSPELRLKSLNGKYVKFYRDKLEDAAIVGPNQFVSNGVVHVISKPLVPKPNVWDYIQAANYKMKDYILGLNYTVLDPASAEQSGVDPLTGKPIFKPGTGLVLKNHLFEKAGHLANEDQEYTFILLADAALEAEKNKLKPYTQAATTDSTDKLASLYVIKDLVFKGLYTPENLPGMLTSQDGVKVPIDKNAIISYAYTSNGIVYVMRAAEVALADKILPVRVEGEAPAAFSRTDKSGNISYRLRKNPETGALFNDIYIFNHKVPRFHVQYDLPKIYSAKYKVYWSAPNDVQTLSFKQRFAVNDPASTQFPETEVKLDVYEEVYVGEFTVSELSDLKVYIVGANNGVDQTNSINLDYFKLVPQLP